MKNIKENLESLKKELVNNKITAILIRSTDRYLNEYVPKHASIRYMLTGFDGSMGDAIITQNKAFLFVDGRYELQAKKQAPGFEVFVTSNQLGIEDFWLSKLSSIINPKEVFAYDPSTVDLNLFEKMAHEANKIDLVLNANARKIFENVLSVKEIDGPAFEPYMVSENYTGSTVEEKIATITQYLAADKVNGFLITKLDDIAWLCNVRSDFFPFQKTLPSIAAVYDKKVLLGLFAQSSSTLALPQCITLTEGNSFFSHLAKEVKGSLGIDIKDTTKEHVMGLNDWGITIKEVKNPLALLKARKNEKELLHMRKAFKKADEVVHKTICFVQDAYEKGQILSEGQIEEELKKNFEESKASGLSFRPICAGAENGAIIHYPAADHNKKMAHQEMFLMDTGAFYEGGYATDLTRTFLIGKKDTKAQDWQKKMFTLVLKASIKGLSARIKKGTTGAQLDAIVRQPLWQCGIDFAHGTGHGVGINVHEFPPRIAFKSDTVLHESQVFSIEPGIYIAGKGGVRIENLVTLVQDPQLKDFLRVLPLTFCPLDKKLIDENMLEKNEKDFLVYYEKEWRSTEDFPSLPPLTNESF